MLTSLFFVTIVNKLLQLYSLFNQRVDALDSIIVERKAGLTAKKKYDLQGVYKYLLLQFFCFLFNGNS